MGRYPQQLTTAFLFRIIFIITRSTSYHIIQYINAFANCISMAIIYAITKLLGKKYNVNTNYSIIIYICFLVLPFLSTFFYGDIISLTLSLASIYFIMKYAQNKESKLWISAAFLMSLSCMFRMNNLIWLIAMVIYLILDLLKNKYDSKEILKHVLIIFAVILIVVMPGEILKLSLMNKYDIDKETSFPAIGFIYLGMIDGERTSGWFDWGTAEMGWNNPKESKEMYKSLAKEKLDYYIKNPRKFIKFYITKITTMWTENTYESIWNNMSFNNSNEAGKETHENDEKLSRIREITFPLQKGVILSIFLCSAVILIQNRKKLENEVILLVLIFLGGLSFHTIWEAKSRYAIPYIVALIPLISINININREKIKNIFNKKSRM